MYTALGGCLSQEKLLNDFLIIACSSIKNLDVVVSSDGKTMLSELAVKAYMLVNKTKGIPLPRLISYEVFKNEIRK